MIDGFDLKQVLIEAEKLTVSIEKAVSESVQKPTNDARMNSVNANVAIALNTLKKELGDGNKAAK